MIVHGGFSLEDGRCLSESGVWYRAKECFFSRPRDGAALRRSPGRRSDSAVVTRTLSLRDSGSER
jgi:hypothetical protein